MANESRKDNLGKFLFWGHFIFRVSCFGNQSLSLGSIAFSLSLSPSLAVASLFRSIPWPSGHLRPPHWSQNLPCLFPFQTRPRLSGIATGPRRNPHRWTRRRLETLAFGFYYFRPNWSAIFEGFRSPRAGEPTCTTLAPNRSLKRRIGGLESGGGSPLSRWFLDPLRSDLDLITVI